MSLFSRARRVLRRLLDAAAGKAHDGPDLPPRFADEARLFLILNPAASAPEWEAFALSLARAAYRDAYGRGVEQAFAERGDPIPLLRPDDAEAREASLREAAARLGAMLGGWRAVIVEPGPPRS